MEKKYKTAAELRQAIGIRFPKGLAEANYDYESYQSNLLSDIQKENELLKQAIQKFVDKNFIGGSKCDREDYTQMVSCKDIWDLRELILDVKN